MTIRRFPIIDGPSIPWEVIAPHGAQAERNHDQTLEKLAARGGLSAAEAWFVLHDEQWTPGCNWKKLTEAGLQMLNEINRRYEEGEQLRKKHEEHLQHVQRFLLSMYQMMVDPVEEFQGDIPALCEVLLKRATEDRERIYNLESALGSLVLKLKTVFESEDYKSVFVLAHVHGMDYRGPSVEQELKAAQEVLNGGLT